MAWTIALAGCASAQQAPAPIPAVITVEYLRSGGFAGLDDHLIVKADRQVSFRTRAEQRSFTVTTTAFSALSDAVAAIPAGLWTGETAGDIACCDQITHVIRSAGRAVRFHDDTTPPEFRRLVRLLVDLAMTR